MIKALLLIIITIFVPPVGVFLVAGCGMDLLINIFLTILGYLPGHVHAFYLEYVYFKRRDEVAQGIHNARPAPGVYSQKVQNGGRSSRALAVAQATSAQPGHVPAQQGYVDAPTGQAQQGYAPMQGQQQQGYGTV